MKTETVFKKKAKVDTIVGILPCTEKNSVEEVREIRRKLSKGCENMDDEEFFDFMNSP